MWITLSFPPQLSVKSSVTSKRTIATLLLTLRRKWRTLHPPHPSQGTTSSRAERSSPSAPSGSALQSVSSSLPSSAWNSRASTRSPSTPSRNATSISARTYTPTPSYQGVPPCSQDSPKGCRRRSPLLFLPRWKWRSSLLQGGSTLCGLEDPSWPAIVPFRGCGSANRNMTSLVLRLFTGSVCKCQHFTFLWLTLRYLSIRHKCKISLSFYVRRRAKKEIDARRAIIDNTVFICRFMVHLQWRIQGGGGGGLQQAHAP